MINSATIDSVLKRIQPAAIKRFLEKRSFRRTGGRPDQVDVYANSTNDIILVPLDPTKPNYVKLMRDMLDMFTTDTVGLDDVVGAVVLPDSDILRYRIETAESLWGHLALNYTQSVMHAVFDLLMYTAAGVSSKRREYRRVSESAKAFAESCKFGQTEYGSFILKVFCPTNPLRLLGNESIPIGRATTRAVIENLDYLSSERVADSTEPLPPTMNRQVASAVCRLQPRDQLGTSASVHVHYTGMFSTDSLGQQQHVQSTTASEAYLDLSPFVYSRARSVYDRLKAAEAKQRELLRGFIIDLHKDRPVRSAEQSQAVTLDVRFGTSWRKLSPSSAVCEASRSWR